MAFKQRHQGNEMPTKDKITAAIYESDGKKFKMESEFFLFKRLTATTTIQQPQTDTDGTMESNTKSAFAENHLFETSDNIVQKR